MEYPNDLENIMQFKFLMGSWHLGLYWRLLGLTPVELWDDTKSYDVCSGSKAIEKLRATGAAAGFEYAAKPEADEEVFQRFAEIIEDKYMNNRGFKS